MAKRAADTQLTKDDLERGMEADEEPGEHFDKADDATLASRVIAKPPQEKGADSSQASDAPESIEKKEESTEKKEEKKDESEAKVENVKPVTDETKPAESVTKTTEGEPAKPDDEVKGEGEANKEKEKVAEKPANGEEKKSFWSEETSFFSRFKKNDPATASTPQTSSLFSDATKTLGKPSTFGSGFSGGFGGTSGGFGSFGSGSTSGGGNYFMQAASKSGFGGFAKKAEEAGAQEKAEAPKAAATEPAPSVLFENHAKGSEPVKKVPAPPKHEEVPEGEENENNVLKTRVKLYVLEDKQWTERGDGQLRLNDAKDKSYSRLVMRTTGGLRLVLNCKVFAGMGVESASEKAVRFVAPDSDGRVRTFLLMASRSECPALLHELRTRVERLKESEEKA
eukprot:Colp12_sorted_trinity150504_noHs@7307